MALAGGLAGGIGLFLLGMGLMTDGLKLAAGPALERILASSTQTRLRGLASGMLVTAVVQSSTAVTVAMIGFVNAGLLNLSQVLWVLFGSNVGSTMTGWLVALVSLKFKIEALALPLIGIGMFLRLTGTGTRRGAVGMSIAGFGLLFLGIDMLKETFSGLSTDFKVPEGSGMAYLLLQVGIGILLTTLMQSSAATLAVAMTAAQGGMISLEAAAAVTIGANVGTTLTALLAAIGATANAKRSAAAHILFNVLTAVVAIITLPWLLGMLTWLQEAMNLEDSPAAKLALFHSMFNVLGLVLMWPLADRLTAFLNARFKSEDDDEGVPRYLDKNVQAVPAFALEALAHEVRHMGTVAIITLKTALNDARDPGIARNKAVVARLATTIADFIVQINRTGMLQDQSEILSRLLRQARYYESATELAVESAAVRLDTAHEPAIQLPESEKFFSAARTLLSLCNEAAITGEAPSLREAQRDAEQAYQALKARLLQLAVDGQIPVPRMDIQLRSASVLRRALDQVSKASIAMPPSLTPNAELASAT